MRYFKKHQKISFVGMFMDYYGLENLCSQDYNKGSFVCTIFEQKTFFMFQPVHQPVILLVMHFV